MHPRALLEAPEKHPKRPSYSYLRLPFHSPGTVAGWAEGQWRTSTIVASSESLGVGGLTQAT
eukprot:9006411-Pyramimonas_sp.AAC.1